MPEIITATEFPNLLRPGMTVFVQAAVGEPLALVQALAAAPEASAGVHYLSCLVPGVNRADYASFNDTAPYRSRAPRRASGNRLEKGDRRRKE